MSELPSARMRLSLSILLALTLAACGGDDDDGGTEASAETLPSMRTEVSWIEPPDVDRYLDGLRRREPERMSRIDEAELVALGEVACNLYVGHIINQSSTPQSVRMEKALRDRGHDAELAGWIAPDIINASWGSICEVERIPVE